jgi:YHS domain-containing protein
MLLATVVVAAEDSKVDLKGIKCPVSGAQAKDIAGSSRDYKGAKVYFCCDNCPRAFDKDTAKFATKANKQLVDTKQAEEVKCPLSGQDLNPDTAIEVAGTKVCFCCNMCKGKVEKAKGDEQLDLVFGDKAFEKGFKVKKAEKKTN